MNHGFYSCDLFIKFIVINFNIPKIIFEKPFKKTIIYLLDLAIEK